MRAVKELPLRYTATSKFELRKDRKLAVLVNVLGFALIISFNLIFLTYFGVVHIDKTITFPSFITICVTFIIGSILMVITHEIIHGMFFYAYTQTMPRFGLSLLYASAAAPDWYIPRGQYLAISMAPFFVMTAAGLLLIQFLSGYWGLMLTIFTAINAGSSAGDIWVTRWVLQHSPQAYVNDRGESMILYDIPE
ncbi:MAG: DUF3267 domain-containing protein [Chloroflexota bacterium]